MEPVLKRVHLKNRLSFVMTHSPSLANVSSKRAIFQGQWNYSFCFGVSPVYFYPIAFILNSGMN